MKFKDLFRIKKNAGWVIAPAMDVICNSNFGIFIELQVITVFG